MEIQCFDLNINVDGDLPGRESPFFPPVFMTWIELYQSTGKVPHKSAFDPVHFPRSLPYSWIYEYLEQDDDFLCRLSGSLVDDAWGEAISDRRMGEFMPEGFRQDAVQRLRKVIQKPAVLHIRRFLDAEQRPAEKLVLPLTDDNDQIRYIFGVSHYQHRPNRFVTDYGPDFLHYFRLNGA